MYCFKCKEDWDYCGCNSPTADDKLLFYLERLVKALDKELASVKKMAGLAEHKFKGELEVLNGRLRDEHAARCTAQINAEKANNELLALKEVYRMEKEGDLPMPAE